MKFPPPAAVLVIVTLPLAACSAAPVANDFAANVSAVREVPAGEGNGDMTAAVNAAAPDYAGRWKGVEGMYLQIASGPKPGTYLIEMQSDLDTKTTVDARAVGDTIVFQRGGETKTLRPADGAATGLKYLAGKKDCLTVASGEGYCRD
jgi:hypothetical protein